MTDEFFKKAWINSVRYLSYRNRSKKEVRDYLLKKQFDDEVIGEVIDQLEKKSLLSDEKFSREWINYSFRRGKGARRVINELREKGISEKIINEEIMDLTSVDSEIERAKICMQKYIKDEYDKEDVRLKRRALTFLLRRGFANEVAYKTLKNFFS